LFIYRRGLSVVFADNHVILPARTFKRTEQLGLYVLIRKI
jgi:hypothetical protein